MPFGAAPSSDANTASCLKVHFNNLFQLEHITARQHGGLSELDNLALACRPCNQKKGPNLAGIDPLTKKLTPLYNPRTHSWTEHFAVVLRHAPTFGSRFTELQLLAGRLSTCLGLTKASCLRSGICST